MLPGDLVLVLIFIGIIAIGLFGVIAYEAHLNFKLRQIRSEKAKQGGNTLPESEDESKGSQISYGMSRTLMTFGIIFILAFAIAFILLELSNNTSPYDVNDVNSLMQSACSTCPGDPTTANALRNATLAIVKSHNDAADEVNKSMIEMAKSVVTVLGGAVSSIVGFYFATRSNQESLDKAKDLTRQKPQEGGETGQTPKITINPKGGPSDKSNNLNVDGKGFAAESEITLVFSKESPTIATTARPKPVTDKKGEFSVTYPIEPVGATGTYYLKATDKHGNSALAEYEAT